MVFVIIFLYIFLNPFSPRKIEKLNFLFSGTREVPVQNLSTWLLLESLSLLKVRRR